MLVFVGARGAGEGPHAEVRGTDAGEYTCAAPR